MTNNEILNQANADGYIGSVSASERKTWEGRAFSYTAKASLTENVPAYRGFAIGDNPVHLKSLDIITSDADVTIEISEDASFTGGTAIVPIARNRKTVLADFRDEKTISFDTATALDHQPVFGTPAIRRVMNNGNVLHPAIAVAITADPIGSAGYGIEVKDVAQIDTSQGLGIGYESKQVRTAIKREEYLAEDWAPDTLKIFTNQSYDESAPVIKAVYNDNNIPLVLGVDYTNDQDVSNDWGITVLSTSETVDDTKNIIIVFAIEEEYNASYSQSIPSWSLDKQKIAIGTPTGTFEVGEVVIGGTSEAVGVLEKIETGFMYLSGVEGVFESGETLTGDDSEATVDTTAIAVKFFWVAFDNQSHDDSAITVAIVANGVRGTIVEYLSFTLDYIFELDTTWKITLKETSKTDATKPVVTLYQAQTPFAEGDGLVVYTAPTVTEQGTVLDSYWIPGSTGIGSERLSSEHSDDWELVLRPNTKYLIKGLSSIAQSVQVKYRWYIGD